MKSSPAKKTLKKPAIRARADARETIESSPLYLQNLFSANVRLVRTARGISQEELADRAALDRTYISSIERRLRNVSIQNVQRLAVALEVDPGDLLNPALAEDPRYLIG